MSATSMSTDVTDQPTGADELLAGLEEAGLTTLFANPGTTELELVRALERRPDLRCFVGLQENVCTGAADGFGRMTGQPAATLLHLGPGFANGIANLHNARRARTPIVNLVGDQASWHLAADAPLTSDIESLARPVSGWVHRLAGPQHARALGREAVCRSLEAGGQVVTLILPADFQADPAPRFEGSKARSRSSSTATEWTGTEGSVRELARQLQACHRPLFLLGGGGPDSALGTRGQRAVARLCHQLGGTAYAETFPSRAERGAGLPAFDRLPYFPEAARAVLDAADRVVLVGALPPVTYFGYPGHPSRLADEARVLTLSRPGDAAAALLEELAEALGCEPWQDTPRALPADVDGPLTPAGIAAALARRIPKGSIVSIEGGTCGYAYYAASAGAARHTALTNTGGAIGQGLPVAWGAALACPERKVVGLLSDGSTQYTVQALWSIARQQSDVTVLIAANHQYAILRNELTRNGTSLGARADTLTSLAQPCIDWVGLAHAYGVPGLRAEDGATLTAGLAQAFSHRGPMLIEMAL